MAFCYKVNLSSSSIADPRKLFLNKPNNTHYYFTIYEEEPFIIPCRVSDPEAPVRLIINQEEAGPELGAIYDPKVGFRVQSSSRGGMLACVAYSEARYTQQYFIASFEGKFSLYTI